MKPIKTIGILGGLGPIASANLYWKILEECQKKYGAFQDDDYPQIIINSLPIPDFDEKGSLQSEQIVLKLQNGLQCLERAGADLIVMACNTVHLHYDSLQANLNVPLLNLIEETVTYFQQFKYKKIGLISSETTRKNGLYSKAFARTNKEILGISESDQDVITKSIAAVMGGKINEVTRYELTKVIKKLEDTGADVLLIGCTELPLAVKYEDVRIPIIDATRVLAEKAVELAYNS